MLLTMPGGKAHLRSGLSKKITPDEYAAMIADNTICDALADYAVQPGDVFFCLQDVSIVLEPDALLLRFSRPRM